MDKWKFISIASVFVIIFWIVFPVMFADELHALVKPVEDTVAMIEDIDLLKMKQEKEPETGHIVFLDGEGYFQEEPATQSQWSTFSYILEIAPNVGTIHGCEHSTWQTIFVTENGTKIKETESLKQLEKVLIINIDGEIVYARENKTSHKELDRLNTEIEERAKHIVRENELKTKHSARPAIEPAEKPSDKKINLFTNEMEFI